LGNEGHSHDKKMSGHGSITKAGKVRNQTPDRGKKTTVRKARSGPRMDNRQQYELYMKNRSRGKWNG
jgi:ribosomal protein S30